MASPDPALSVLRGQRAACAQDLDACLAAGRPIAELKDLDARLRLLDAAIAAKTPRAPSRRNEVLALLAVGALVSLAALLPMPRVDFVLDIDTEAAQMTMPAAGELSGARLGPELRAEGFARAESADPAWQRRALEEGPATLSLSAERMALRGLTHEPGARIDWRPQGALLRLAVDGAAHAAVVDFGGAVQSSLGGAPRTSAQVPVAEWLRLSARTEPTELWLSRPAGATWSWRGLQPDRLRFTEREAASSGAARVQSALRKATIRLPATGAEIAVAAGSAIEIDGARLERCELVAGDDLKLNAAGSASRLVLATAGFERSLKPSLLEYLARNHRLALFWSAAGVLWGLVAWWRRWFGV